MPQRFRRRTRSDQVFSWLRTWHIRQESAWLDAKDQTPAAKAQEKNYLAPG
jgi:hypothetical protein